MRTIDLPALANTDTVVVADVILAFTCLNLSRGEGYHARQAWPPPPIEVRTTQFCSWLSITFALIDTLMAWSASSGHARGQDC